MIATLPSSLAIAPSSSWVTRPTAIPPWGMYVPAGPSVLSGAGGAAAPRAPWARGVGGPSWGGGPPTRRPRPQGGWADGAPADHCDPLAGPDAAAAGPVHGHRDGLDQARIGGRQPRRQGHDG